MNNHSSETESIVQIDELNLDKECIRQPGLVLQWATQAAEKRKDIDEAKAELDVVEADLSRKIRQDCGAYGLEKVTETAVAGVILLQKSYRTAHQKLLDARYQHELAQAVVSALEHKKRSLTLLVELHGIGYCSSPRLSQKGQQAVQEMTKKKVRRFREDRDRED